VLLSFIAELRRLEMATNEVPPPSLSRKLERQPPNCKDLRKLLTLLVVVVIDRGEEVPKALRFGIRQGDDCWK
jgi:hypothetical protein